MRRDPTCVMRSAPTRRDFFAAATGVAAALLPSFRLPRAQSGPARLAARPGRPMHRTNPGRFRLGLGARRDGLLRVPPRHDASTPSALIVALHGAGQDAREVEDMLGPYAGTDDFLLLAVDSRGETWDAVRGSFGPDVAFIDRALAWTFARCSVDPGKTSVAGFSDGASYALGLGLANGDLFRRIVAFSPGFIPGSNPARVGAPSIFVSHGRADPVIPVSGTRNGIVPALEEAGYVVTYEEFDAGHEVPARVARAAMAWLGG